jgi:hypothetical protein
VQNLGLYVWHADGTYVLLARIIHEGQGLRSADVREGGAWGAIGGVG